MCGQLLLQRLIEMFLKDNIKEKILFLQTCEAVIALQMHNAQTVSNIFIFKKPIITILHF